MKKTNYNTKIIELENKIPDISNLATKTALTTVENKIPSVSNLVKKTDYNIKVTEIENKLTNHNHDKYIDNSECDKLHVDAFNARLAQANLITKTDFDTKLSSLNRRNTQYKSKHLLVENELTTLENKIPNVSSLIKKADYNTKVAEIDTNVSNLDGKIAENKDLLTELGTSFFPYMSGNIMFDDGDGSQAYLIFQPVHKYIKIIAYTKYISEWKSKGLSDESMKPFPTSDNSLTPLIDYYDYNITVKFNGSILRQLRVSYTQGKEVNIYIVYELGASSSHSL